MLIPPNSPETLSRGSPLVTDWEGALCANLPADTPIDFFSGDETKIQEAKDLCAGCPLRRKCLEYSLEERMLVGVWGGVDAVERRRDLALDVNGEYLEPFRGPIRCPDCGPRSTRFLYVIEKRRKSTRIGCSNCGLNFTTRKIISKNQTNY